ncbi:MAG: hypothetical protein QOF43_2112 [Gaiellaceae bacterium]|nr:hypothetical protein [Gaiellaceae bacterium]
MSTVLPRRTRAWTPKAIPFGLLILLLGLWAIFAPLVGGYFGFGFYSDTTWHFGTRWWEIHFPGGLAAALGGFMLMTPARGWGALGRLLAFLGGAWLVAGWAFYPVWANGTIDPYGGAFMHGLRWLGQLLGPGGLVLLFTGVANGLFMRRTIVEQAPAVPVETAQVTTPE